MTETELRNQVVNTAKKYLGCKESDGSHKKIIDLYNKNKPSGYYTMTYTDPWCATFVSAVSAECGLTKIIPMECGCERQIQLFKNLNSWVENDAYVPSAGDIIFYDWDDSGSGDNTGYSDHVGIVVSVTGNSIKVIEGNKSDSVSYRTITVNGKYIRGYGIPKYSTVATSTTTETNTSTSTTTTNTTQNTKPTYEYTVKLGLLKNGMKDEQVKTVQRLLIARGDLATDEDDGVFGSKTLAAVKKFQKAKGLDADGEVGGNTWTKLLKG